MKNQKTRLDARGRPRPKKSNTATESNENSKKTRIVTDKRKVLIFEILKHENLICEKWRTHFSHRSHYTISLTDHTIKNEKPEKTRLETPTKKTKTDTMPKEKYKNLE